MRLLPLILFSAGLAAIPTPALCRDGAWYVGGDFGAMIVEDTSFTFEGATPGTFGDLEVKSDMGFDGSLFVGYDLGAFRLEAEVAYKRAGGDEFENSIPILSTGTPHPPGKHPIEGGSTSALSFMINGMLDFGDDDGLSAFVGGGVGVARVDYHELRAFENTGAFLDDSDTRFAWQIVAGLRHAVSNNIDVHMRYRFFNTSDLNLKGVTDRPIDSGKFSSHSLLAGITFNFGEPPK